MSQKAKAGKNGVVYLTRKAEFAASHYYHNPALSAEENRRLFGKCNNPHGHGHNYLLEVTVKGKVDARSGFVLDLKELKEILKREVLEAMDHRFLNKEVAEFELRKLSDELGIKAGLLINGSRTLTTGVSVGPPLFDLLECLGQDIVVGRLEKAETFGRH